MIVACTVKYNAGNLVGGSSVDLSNMATQILIKGTFSSIIYWDHKLYFVTAVWADLFQ